MLKWIKFSVKQKKTFLKYWKIGGGEILEKSGDFVSGKSGKSGFNVSCSRHYRHAGIPREAVTYIAGQLDPILNLPQRKKAKKPQYKAVPQNGTGEEQHSLVIRAYDSLSKQLRTMEEFPLAIHTIQGTDPVFRFSEVRIYNRCFTVTLFVKQLRTKDKFTNTTQGTDPLRHPISVLEPALMKTAHWKTTFLLGSTYQKCTKWLQFRKIIKTSQKYYLKRYWKNQRNDIPRTSVRLNCFFLIDSIIAKTDTIYCDLIYFRCFLPSHIWQTKTNTLKRKEGFPLQPTTALRIHRQWKVGTSSLIMPFSH